MALYVIGDVQGCFDELQALLDKIQFDPQHDRLWFTGDLINRGPASLATLHYVQQLGESAVTVLGNHDLHCLAVADGFGRLHNKDTLTDILTAPDRDELLQWLRRQPLLHHDAQLDVTMVHAGMAPQWDLQQARACAAEVEQALRSEDYREFFANMYGDTPALWSDTLHGWDRLRFITNCFTRLRFVDGYGQLCLSAKGPLGSQPHGWQPWFQTAHRMSRGHTILFGHWSALGLYVGDDVIGLDTGCLWGGALTALRLGVGENGILDKTQLHITRIECAGVLTPHME